MEKELDINALGEKIKQYRIAERLFCPKTE